MSHVVDSSRTETVDHLPPFRGVLNDVDLLNLDQVEVKSYVGGLAKAVERKKMNMPMVWKFLNWKWIWKKGQIKILRLSIFRKPFRNWI